MPWSTAPRQRSAPPASRADQGPPLPRAHSVDRAPGETRRRTARNGPRSHRAARRHGRQEPLRRAGPPAAPAGQPAAARRGHRTIRRGRLRLPAARHPVPRRADQVEGRLVQYAGRILRPHPGKATAEIPDYHDTATGVLAASLAGRAPGYTSLGFPDPRRITSTPSATSGPGPAPLTAPVR